MRRLFVFVSLFLLLVGCTPAAGTSKIDPAQPGTPPAEPTPLAVQVSPAPVSLMLDAAQFADAAHGRANGPDRSLITTDGGNHWAEGPRELVAPDPCADTWVVQGATVAHGDNHFQAPVVGQEWHGVLHCSGSSAWVLFTGGAAASHQAYVAFRTVDDGATWTPILANSAMYPAYPTLKDLPSIDAYSGPFAVLDSHTAFFAGECGPCYGWGTASLTRTRDGGKTWQHDTIPYVRGVSAISFVDADHGWIVAKYGQVDLIMATDDGGRTWQVQYPSAMRFPTAAVSLVNAMNGYGLGRIGDYNALLVTDDGGATWRQTGRLPGDSPNPPDGVDRISFVDPQNGWALSTDDRLLRTTDGGQHWAEVNLPTSKQAATGVRFTSPQSGCVQIGSGYTQHSFWRTSDGGSTWQEAAGTGGVVGCARNVAPPRAGATLLEATADGLLWAQATDGAIEVSADNGRTSRFVDWPKDSLARPLLAVSFGSKTNGVAITSDLQFLRTIDGGATWTTIR